MNEGVIYSTLRIFSNDDTGLDTNPKWPSRCLTWP